MDLKQKIRNIKDWPKPGIVFRDISTLLADPAAYEYTLDRFCEYFGSRRIDKVLGIEARGFIFGGALASRLNVGFVPARKPKKLPYETLREEYALEYGTDALEIHTDALTAGERVLVVDDLVATGGTLTAAVRLVERAGGEIAGIGVVIDLAFLKGLEALGQYDVFSLVRYDSE